ncbi:MAG: tRNA (5-methylaminomethyl-2-thiouridine)(34)-methyltransferase MnmD [Bacteroidota bacterium]
MNLKIITTEDGSHSLFDSRLNETYHSTRGAKGESIHVFLEAGLNFWLAKCGVDSVKILEVGFGTGLNALLTAMITDKRRTSVHYSTLEPYPIPETIAQGLNYAKSKKEQDLFGKIQDAEWNVPTAISDQFSLEKINSTLEDFPAQGKYDVIFFDAFAPKKQPEVWSLENLQKCYSLLDFGGVLTTYCAMGQFKRDLATAGFIVETLPGAMGKKEMVRALKEIEP